MKPSHLRLGFSAEERQPVEASLIHTTAHRRAMQSMTTGLGSGGM